MSIVQIPGTEMSASGCMSSLYLIQLHKDLSALLNPGRPFAFNLGDIFGRNYGDLDWKILFKFRAGFASNNQRNGV